MSGKKKLYQKLGRLSQTFDTAFFFYDVLESAESASHRRTGVATMRRTITWTWTHSMAVAVEVWMILWFWHSVFAAKEV